MFRDSIEAVVAAAKGKLAFSKDNPLGFLLSSILAGVFIGFGILLAFTASSLLPGASFAKIIMGLVFGIALSLVVMAGAELFTGNNFVMGVGLFEKEVGLGQVIKFWLICYIGNWIGGILLAFLFNGTGLMNEALTATVSAGALAKASVPFGALLIRGILCNILVCLAVWCGIKLKSESGKLIMIFWCLLAFITLGFEHSIANMTLLTLELLQAAPSIGLDGYFYNLFVVTLGNMIGGILFVAMPYATIGRKKV